MNDDYTNTSLIGSRVKTVSGIYSIDYTGIIIQLFNGIGQTIAVIKTPDGKFFSLPLHQLEFTEG